MITRMLEPDSDEFDATRMTFDGKRLRGKIATAFHAMASPADIEECSRRDALTTFVDPAGRRLYDADEVAVAVALLRGTTRV